MNFLKEVKEEREHMPLEPLTLKMERHVYVHAYIRVQGWCLIANITTELNNNYDATVHISSICSAHSLSLMSLKL